MYFKFHYWFYVSVKFSLVQFLTDWVVGGGGGTWQTIQQRSFPSLYCRRPLWAVLEWPGISNLWCCPSSISPPDHCVAHPPNGFGEPVGACDRLEPCKFPSIDRCQRKFLWTQKDVDLALQPILDLVLQVREAKNFSQTLGLENLDLFFFSFF